MIKKILYTCQICNTDYADKEKAIACEKSHKALEEIINPIEKKLEEMKNG